MFAQQVGERSPDLSPKVLEWMKQAIAFESQAAYGKATQLWELILGWRKKALGPDHPDTVSTRDLLVQCRKALIN